MAHRTRQRTNWSAYKYKRSSDLVPKTTARLPITYLLAATARRGADNGEEEPARRKFYPSCFFSTSPPSILETRPMEDDRLVILYKHGYFYPIMGRFRNGL